MQIPMLYCQDPLHPRAADQHFANEAKAARELGATLALLDHDALLQGHVDRAVERVRRVPIGSRAARMARDIQGADTAERMERPSAADGTSGHR
jgi:hypothetical protein